MGVGTCGGGRLAPRLRVVSGEFYPDCEAMYRDNVDRVYRLMFAKVGNRPDAEDLTAASGVIHAELYIHGYRAIPGVGPAFLLQASGGFAVAVLLLLTASVVPRLAAAGLAFGAPAGFAASRTVGIFGFVERGLQPAPQALISVLVEIATLLLLVAPLLCRDPRHHSAASITAG
jgi:hypothetical protein